jgi:hypothetical protein
MFSITVAFSNCVRIFTYQMSQRRIFFLATVLASTKRSRTWDQGRKLSLSWPPSGVTGWRGAFNFWSATTTCQSSSAPILLPAARTGTNEANSTKLTTTTMPRKAQHRARAVAGGRGAPACTMFGYGRHEPFAVPSPCHAYAPNQSVNNTPFVSLWLF